MNQKIPPEMYLEIFEVYDSGCSQVEIARKYNVSNSCIEKIFKKNNKKTRPYKYTKDLSYFKRIDSEDKAYFLGLIYADGWVKNGDFGISLQEKDEHILQEFKNYLKFNGPIYTIKPKKPHHAIRKRIEICSKEIIQDLNKLGVVKNKSLILKFPTDNQVPKKYLNHFIRGYFDGDGGISYNNKTKKLQCSMTSSEAFCKKICEILKKELNIKFHNRCDGRSEAHTVKTDSRQALIFLNYIYENSSKNLRLFRKFKLFTDILFAYRMQNLDHTRGSKIPVKKIKKICFNPKYALLR